jgi:5-formyltetrahydrofolate cyclo-ligase
VRLRCAYAACEWVLTERVMGSKADIRARVLARRDGLAPEQRIEMSLAMAEAAEALSFDPGTVIAGYLPIRSEPDLRPLLARLRERGARLCLPVVMDRRPSFSEISSGGGSRQDRVRHFRSRREAEVLEPDLLLMPLSSSMPGATGSVTEPVIRQGNCKAQGQGKVPVLIGAAFSVQEVEALPAEDHDVALDMILTEQGLRSLSQSL